MCRLRSSFAASRLKTVRVVCVWKVTARQPCCHPITKRDEVTLKHLCPPSSRLSDVDVRTELCTGGAAGVAVMASVFPLWRASTRKIAEGFFHGLAGPSRHLQEVA
jgi:hypothetical protein